MEQCLKGMGVDLAACAWKREKSFIQKVWSEGQEKWKEGQHEDSL